MAEAGTAGAPPPARSFNHRAWLGPLLAVFGLASYFGLFYWWPLFRDVPWLNLLILAAAVGLSLSAWPRSRSTLGRVGSAAGLVVSVGMLAMLCFYAFYWSYQLPDAGRVADDGTRIPAIALTSWDGQTVDLAEAASGDLILVFYRGFW